MNKTTEAKRWQPICMAMLLCFYYIIPHSISLFGQLLFFIALVVNRDYRLYKSNILPLSWYIVFALLLLITNIFRIDYNNPESLGYITTTLNNILFILMTIYSIRSKKDISIFLNYFGVFGFLLTLYILPFALVMVQLGQGRLGTTVEIVGIDYLNNPITLGYILMLINICHFYSLVSSKSIKSKLFFLICFSCSLFCVLMSGTRKALVCCVLCYLAYVYFENRKYKGKLILYSVIAIVIAFLLYQMMLEIEPLYNIMGKRIEGTIGYFNSDLVESDADKSTEGRANIILVAKEIFEDNPIFGAGISETQRRLAVHSHPHNNYYALLDFGGIVVFLSYYWFFTLLLFRNLKRLNDTTDVLLLCLLFSYLLGDYTATTYNVNYFIVFLAVMYLNTVYVCPSRIRS